MTGSRRQRPRPPEDVPCNAVNFSTALTSPKPAVIAGLTAGDCLSVELVLENRRKVVVAKAGQNIAGSITNTIHIRLVECLEAGEPFHAIIDSVSGGHCVVRVAHGPCR
jgi:hypothetical protein